MSHMQTATAAGIPVAPVNGMPTATAVPVQGGCYPGMVMAQPGYGGGNVAMGAGMGFLGGMMVGDMLSHHHGSYGGDMGGGYGGEYGGGFSGGGGNCNGDFAADM